LFSLLKHDYFSVRSKAATSLFQLNQKTETILPDVVQWIEAQPDDVPIGAAIDGLWAMIE